MRSAALHEDSKITESKIERYFVEQIKGLGGEIRKVKWIGRNHAPDRLVFFKGVWFVEFKRPGGRLRPGQEREHKLLKRNGARVFVINTFDQVNNFVQFISTSGIPESGDGFYPST